MQKVTIKEKEKQSKDIDWTKGYFINKLTGGVVTATRSVPKIVPRNVGSNEYFFAVNSKGTVFAYYRKDFRPFEGTITVEME